MDGPGTDLQPYPIQGYYAGKFLAHSFHLQEIRHVGQDSGDLRFVEGFL
jgi:hypothetical protein